MHLVEILVQTLAIRIERCESLTYLGSGKENRKTQ